MLLEFKDDDYRKLADRINERVAKDYSYAKAGKIQPDQLKFAITEAREFFLEQGGREDRSSHLRDFKATIHPPEAGHFFKVDLNIGGPSGAGGYKIEAIPQHERVAERKRNLMEDGRRVWMTVDVGESIRRFHETRGSDCNPTAKWDKADWLMEKGRLFDEAKQSAMAADAERPAARMAPPPPAFMVRESQRPAIQR